MFLSSRMPKQLLCIFALCAVSIAGYSSGFFKVLAAIERFGSASNTENSSDPSSRDANVMAPLSGTYNIPGDYATLDAAITDLNLQGVGGAVTLDLVAGNPQTAPAGGYVIGGTGSALLTTTSATNTVTIQGNGNTITASGSLTAGSLNDAIFKLIGADWITVKSFTMIENPANTTTTAASNNMTEWGVALLYVSTTDGSQNDTIQGNTIDLDRTYQNTFGIYANATHSATAVSTSATATGAAGGNSGLKAYGNTITDVNNGIVVVGPTAAVDHNDGIEIGGSVATANSITNFGTTGSFSSYANVSGTVNGILVRNSRNVMIGNNTITSFNGGVTSGTLNGVQIPAASNTPSGAFSTSINNNSIALKSGVLAGAINGISSPGGSASTTSTININGNDFNNFGHTVANASGTITFITNASVHLNQNIQNNTFTSNTVNTTGNVTFISNSNTSPTGGVKNVNGNSIVTGFNKTGAGGTVTFFTDNGSDPEGAANNSNNNNFSNVTVTGATTVIGISNTNGGSPNKNVTGNTVSNITGGTSTITAISINFDGGTTVVNSNTVSNISNGAAINGITFGTTGAGTTTASFNNVNGLSATSGSSLIAPITVNSGTGTRTLSRNKIWNIENTSASGAIWGLFISSVANTVNVQNNLIGDLRTPNAAGESLRGININSSTASTTLNLSYNTVYLNTTATGSNFASTGIFHTTSATATTAALNLRDNIIVNTSAFTGTGNTVAYRRSSTALNNYGSVSNNNLFYAGSPGASNLIFSDGTNNLSSLASYKSLVSSRDSASVTENPPFLSTNGSNANFLHINTTVATRVESGGIPVSGISDDFDGDTRSATTPDLGADEFAGMPIELNPPNISYTVLTNTSLTTNRTVNAAISDPSGVAGGANAPRIYFKKNSGSYFSTQCTGTYICTIDNSLVGGVTAGDVISYFVIAQDSLGNVGASPGGGLFAADVNNVSTPPTMPNTYTIIPTIPASVNVGTGETYTSLSNNDAGGIFNAINNGVLASNTIINITSDLTAETGAVALNEWAEEGTGGYTLTIKPSGAARTISGSSMNSIIRFNGADRVTIDGSLTAETATGVGGNATLRNLTVQNTNTAATAGAVIAVTQGANSANNVTIKNVIVSGQDPTQTLIGIHVGGNTVGASPTTSSNNNVVIDNCAFKRSFIGIFDNGASAAAAATGNVITHNDLTATGADRMRRAGISFFNQNGILVQENAIGGIAADESADAIGIIAGIQNVTTTATTSGGVFNAIIAKNRISGVTSTNITGFSAVGIAIAGDPAGDNFIGNNMISGVSAPSTGSDIVAGVFVAGVFNSNTHLFYNSVSLTGNRGAVADQIGSYALAITGANPTVELKDNIFYNTQTSGGGANAKSYAIGIGTSALTNLASNYNDFVSTGANAGGFRTTSLDATGTDLADLTAWQSATGGDANSMSVDPSFIDPAADLHVAGTSQVLSAGIAVAAINDDIDSQPRGSQPDIGADEVQPGTIQLSSNTYTAAETDGMTALTVKRTGGVDGAVSVDYSTGGGTAAGGAMCGGTADYVTTSGTINFANGDGSDKTIMVPICNDSFFEGNETFVTTLSNAMGGAAIGANSSATTTITDDETIPSVQFSSETYSTVEAIRSIAPDGSPGATINVTLSGPSQSNVTIHYSTSDGSATGGMSCSTGIDYVSVSGTATILSGQTSTSFFVPTCADTVSEGDETVNLLLSGPSGATLGMPNFAVLTIVDNDAPTGPITVSATAGTTAPTAYMTLKEAIDAINAGTHQGDITIGIVTSTVEANAPIVLNGSGAGSASYTSVLIRPISDGVSVSGATPTGRGLIELNGADNVTIDGDNPNTAGVNRNLTLQNTATSTTTFTSVVRLALAATVVTSTDNVIVKNLNIAGSATGRNVSGATSTTGSENATFGIFAGPGASTVSDTTAPSAVTSVSSSIGTGASATDLVVSNNNISTAARAISINGSATTVFPNLVIKNNQIGNPTVSAADQVYSIGITAQGSPNGVISGNTVWVEGYIGSSSATHGIDVGVNSASGTFTIDSNKIDRVQNNNGATWSAYGINLGGGNNHIVQNNFVSGVINSQSAGTGGFGTSFGAYGIRVASGIGHKVYHNSVHLYGAMPGTTSTDLTASFLVAATSQTGLDVRNNIFSNQIVGGNPAGTRNVAVYLPSGGASTMNLTLNNNGYFAGTDALSRLAQVGTTFGSGEYLASNFDPTATTPTTNFRAYTSSLSVAGSNDNASFATSAAPPLVSDVDLHVVDGTHTRLESGGAAVGVTLDVDAETRNAMTPDIGADEFMGQTPFTNDIAAVTLVTPANGAVIPVGQMFSPQAFFLNNGTATQSMITVRYRIVDAMMTEVYNQTAVISTLAPLQTFTATFPSASLPSGGTFSISASAELAGDQDTSNDTITGSVTGVPPVSGPIDVGTGQTYTSLTNPGGIFQALNAAGISGNVTINITSDLTGETGAIALDQLAETGPGGYTVTIKPSGAARLISGTSVANSGMIILNGADRIVIDGSTSGGTDRSLTITNNQTSTTSVIWMRSPSASNGATNNTVKNCIINGAPGPNSTTTAGILTGSGTTLGNDAEAPNSNNSIQNNWIYRVQNSIYLRGGTSAANFDQNWTVVGNELGSSNADDKNIFRGMLIGNAKNFTISGNSVHGIQSTGTTSASMSGIQLALLLDTGSVIGNTVYDIKNVSANGTGAAGISVIATSTASNVTIANNFVSDVAANGSATVSSNGFGISFQSASTSSGYNIYFNSVNMSTNQSTAQSSGALFVNSTITTAGAIDLRNNIFADNETTGSRFGVYSLAAANVFTAIDYNDYFAQNVGFIGGSTRTTLSDWQMATGADANSKALDPLFVSSSDLHLQAGSPMRDMGVTGTDITTDIDGEMRDAMPDIGADELPFMAMPGTLKFSSATYSIGEGGGTATITVTRTGGSNGAVGVNYATTDGTATGGASCGGSVDYMTTSGTLMWADGDSADKTFTIPICNDLIPEADETVNIALSNASGGATIGTPGTAVLTITNDDIPGTISVNDVRVWEGNSGTVNATFTVSYIGNAIPVSVQYSTANGTAIAGVDYMPASGTLVFNAPPVAEIGGFPTQTQTVTVHVVGDVNKEENETFFLNLSNPTNAVIADGQGVGIINDEDRAFISDFDRDKTADLSVYRPSEGRWYVLQTTNGTPKVVPFGNADDRPVPGDYDGDGYVDYAVWRTTTGTWYIQSSLNNALTIVDWGLPGDKPVQGDYDGDGKTDIAVYRPSTGYWWFILSSDGSRPAFQFGLSSDLPVQADYDGDAKTDLAIYRAGTWYIARSRDGQVQVANFGIASDKPVVGDFDGDGSYDVAVYRDGDWWIANSLTGIVRSLHWGLASDVPVPADYDNDAITDIAVFRPSNGDWYILKSTTDTLLEVHWGADGDIPTPAGYLPQ